MRHDTKRHDTRRHDTGRHDTGRHDTGQAAAHGGHGVGHAAQTHGQAGDAPLTEREERRRLNALAVSATLHCLTGCAIGEVLGLVIGTALGWSELQTVALAVGLAFLFGYSLTVVPVLRSGLALGAAVKVALVADTLSITVMEVVDNGVMLAVPGAMEAGLASPLFWGSLAFALAVAFAVTVPVNRALIARGRGHAVVHRHHH